jgi:hypothetical protein
MRREVVLVIFLVPLTAIIAAAVTNLVMRDLAPAAPVPIGRSLLVAEAVPSKPPHLELRSVETSAPPPVAAVVVAHEDDRVVSDPAEPLPPPPKPEAIAAPAVLPAVATGDEAAARTAVDFIRLSEDMQHVSEALERFNTKLLRLIDVARSGQGGDSIAGPGETAGDEPDEREAGP